MSMSAHAYRTTRKPGRSEATRERIKGAVRELLAEGTFHTSTVEHVADRAGISRATLYQPFRSRLELVDAICETFDANPALLELRQIVELPDAEAVLDKTIANSIRFWSSEDAVLRQLYGVAAVDPAAQKLVDRQRADRRSGSNGSSETCTAPNGYVTGRPRALRLLLRTHQLRDLPRTPPGRPHRPAADRNTPRGRTRTAPQPAKTPTLAVTPDARQSRAQGSACERSGRPGQRPPAPAVSRSSTVETTAHPAYIPREGAG